MKAFRCLLLVAALVGLLGAVGCARSKEVGAKTGALVENALHGGSANAKK
jgi:hypothetical protein